MNKYLMDKRVILASASPRRQELMRLLCDDFEVIPSLLEETVAAGASDYFVDFTAGTAEYLARLKCDDIAGQNPDAFVIGCDTVISTVGQLLGKPSDGPNAAKMLRLFSGREHRVVTGVCLEYKGYARVFSSSTWVYFYPITEEEIQEYIATGEYEGKAGGYAIQGLASLFVKKIEGDFFNVVGMPVALVNNQISDFCRKIEERM